MIKASRIFPPQIASIGSLHNFSFCQILLVGRKIKFSLLKCCSSHNIPNLMRFGLESFDWRLLQFFALSDFVYDGERCSIVSQQHQLLNLLLIQALSQTIRIIQDSIIKTYQNQCQVSEDLARWVGRVRWKDGQIQKQEIRTIYRYIQQIRIGQVRMICINSKRNQKLLQTFNNDPYSDIVIKTSSSELHLVLGYLSIDSQFFDEQPPTIREINLDHLHENALIKILRALYGQELYAYTVNELKELYHIIDYLKINEYKDNIVKYISKNQQLMDNFQLIQFCFSTHMLEDQIRKHHFDLKLAVLASTKNYLQLNKISQHTLNSLLIQYYHYKGEEADTTINSIVQNYIGRNDLRPSQYFTQPGLEPLLAIWQKFHHSISYLISAQQKVRQSQMVGADEARKSGMQSAYSSPLTHPIPSLTSNPSIGLSTSSISNLVPTRQSSCQSPTSILPELQQKQFKIQELQRMVELNNQIIQTLKTEIQNAKKQLQHNKKHIHIVESDEESQQLASKTRRKQFDEVLGIGRGNTEDYDVSLIEPPFNQARKIVNEEKEVKTMNKLNTKAKRIFN